MKDVGMMPSFVLGDSEVKELTDDDVKKRNTDFSDKLQNDKEKASKIKVVLMCFLGLICLLSMAFLFHISDRLNGSELTRVYEYTLGVLIFPICLMLMRLQKKATILQDIMFILESPYPKEAARIISELYLQIFHKKELSKKTKGGKNGKK
ncbi:MAG: hypothetical protein HQL03_08505 [Nitrospirae bacterium]|nr:hypothetical protein [Nitrospirota bacterium]